MVIIAILIIATITILMLALIALAAIEYGNQQRARAAEEKAELEAAWERVRMEQRAVARHLSPDLR